MDKFIKQAVQVTSTETLENLCEIKVCVLFHFLAVKENGAQTEQYSIPLKVSGPTSNSSTRFCKA